MAYYLDLADGGPLIPCRDAAHARRLAQLWIVMHAADDRMRERIERLARVGVKREG